MSREATISSLLVLLLLVPASAQSQSLRMQAYFSYGAVSLASSETFDAVAGSTRAGSLGGGVQLTRLWRLLFADLGFSRQRLDGERVFVSDGVVFPLDIPLEVSFTPFDIAAGWRFERHRFSPYVGGGLSLITYKESSPFSRAGDDVNERGTGLLMLAGLDVPVWRFVSVGGELRYRAVSGVLGEGGASEAFGEDQLGGLQYAVRISVQFQN